MHIVELCLDYLVYQNKVVKASWSLNKVTNIKDFFKFLVAKFLVYMTRFHATGYHQTCQKVTICKHQDKWCSAFRFNSIGHPDEKF